VPKSVARRPDRVKDEVEAVRNRRRPPGRHPGSRNRSRRPVATGGPIAAPLARPIAIPAAAPIFNARNFPKEEIQPFRSFRTTSIGHPGDRRSTRPSGGKSGEAAKA